MLNAVVAGRYPLAEIDRFDGALAQVIERALATAPAKRIASADALADALEVYQDQLDTRTSTHRRRASRSKGQKFPNLLPGSVYFADFTQQERTAVLQLANEERYQSGAHRGRRQRRLDDVRGDRGLGPGAESGGPGVGGTQ
jgi:hypothetical protein